MDRAMKRNLLTLMLAGCLLAACAGASSHIPAGDAYRYNPGEADPHPPIGGA
jgi:hypothetical protein